MKFFNLNALAAVVTGVLVAAGPSVAKDYKSITIATEGSYAPYNFKDAGVSSSALISISEMTFASA